MSGDISLPPPQACIGVMGTPWWTNLLFKCKILVLQLLELLGPGDQKVVCVCVCVCGFLIKNGKTNENKAAHSLLTKPKLGHNCPLT